MRQFDTNKLLKYTLTAKSYEVCKRTDLDFMEKISKKIGNNLWIKREDQQPIFSFKIRGAYNKISHLSPEQLKLGVITASAGNHAQGVALSAKIKGISAKIFMPINTVGIKVEAVKNLGAQVILQGNSFSESHSLATAESKKNNIPFIEAFDDPMIIAGQGTIGLEILQDCKTTPDAVFVPVGGGGLISGIAIVLKTLLPAIKIIAVEPKEANSMTLSIANNKIIELDNINTFADGVAVKKVGKLPFEYCKKFVDNYINVSTDEICSAIKIIHNELRIIPEPSGAVGLAGVLAFTKAHKWKNKNIITINTGSNIDFERLKFVVDRTKIGAGKEVLLIIKLIEKPGTLKDFCKSSLSGAKISEFNYRYSNNKQANVFIGLEFKDTRKIKTFFDQLKQNKYSYYELTNNELTKNHLRYMMRGDKNNIPERFFSFSFPENSDALYNFLEKMSSRWNISLLHYRNYGGDQAKIFIGIQAPLIDKLKLDEFVASLKYPYNEETKSLALKKFLNQ